MGSGSTSNRRDGMVAIPAGDYQVGSDRFYPEESPVRQVSIDSFEIDLAPVTNAEFQQFVDATSYQTVSERPPDPTFPDLPPEEQFLNRLFLYRLRRRWIAANLCPVGPHCWS